MENTAVACRMPLLVSQRQIEVCVCQRQMEVCVCQQQMEVCVCQRQMEVCVSTADGSVCVSTADRSVCVSKGDGSVCVSTADGSVCVNSRWKCVCVKGRWKCVCVNSRCKCVCVNGSTFHPHLSVQIQTHFTSFIGLSCKKDLQFKMPTNRSHPIAAFASLLFTSRADGDSVFSIHAQVCKLKCTLRSFHTLSPSALVSDKYQ